jgi:hypothetical protein
MGVAEFVILGYFRLTKTYLHKYKEDIHNIVHATRGTRKPKAEKHRMVGCRQVDNDQPKLSSKL